MLTLSVSPLIPVPVLWLAAAVVTLCAVLACLSRGPVAIIRAVALALILVALANPSLVHEEREPTKSIVVVVIDRSASNQLDDRAAMTERVRAELQLRFGHLPDVEPRFVEAGDNDKDDGTLLFTALSSALADVPPDRVAAVIMVTDGVVHDIPTSTARLGCRSGCGVRP